MQIGGFTPKLKPPGTKRLKLKCDVLLSTSAFKFNLRRYTMVPLTDIPDWCFVETVGREAGAYTRPLLGST